MRREDQTAQGDPPAAGRKTRRRLLAGGLAAAGAAAAMAAGPGIVAGPLRRALAQDITFFRIGTGTTGGTYFPVGGIIAGAISNPPGAPPPEAPSRDSLEPGSSRAQNSAYRGSCRNRRRTLRR